MVTCEVCLQYFFEPKNEIVEIQCPLCHKQIMAANKFVNNLSLFFTEFVDDDGIRWTLEKNRSPVTLMGFYNISWKPKNNHFLRYTDVKPKGNNLIVSLTIF